MCVSYGLVNICCWWIFKQLKDGFASLIRIAYLNILGAELVPKLLHGFQQRYPKIRFELVQGNHTFISNRMENGECDLLISSAKLESDAYEWIPMRTVPLYVVVPLNWIP
ncbi:LysR substrate-binding domain-containing protein [Paenibacillus lautus]|uniref:LysR substrate-binding domain-containing protein n=1 Tax=Paenibacillus lautus TaxID=1401 RepID=UPI003D2D7345